MPEFIPGLTLSEIYYHEAIRPILDRHFPGLPHSAGLIGWGSDVLGFDTPVSTDHFWGPRLRLFLRQEDLARQDAIYEALSRELPVSIRGFSTHFGRPDPLDNGTRCRQDVNHGPVDPLVDFHTIEEFWQSELGVPPSPDPAPADWLTFAEQRLLQVTAGKVFHDDLGLEDARRRFAYYPREVWLYILAAQWELVAQEEAFAGRTAQVGDELGSRVITARLVERFMRLCFLMEKRYAPYSKWFGTAFQRLACYPKIGPLLEELLAADCYAERDLPLSKVYTALAEMHNALGVTPTVETRTRTYSGWHHLRGSSGEELAPDNPENTRPFQVIFAGRLVDALMAAVEDPQVKAFDGFYGSVNQFLVESSDALQSTAFCRKSGCWPVGS